MSSTEAGSVPSEQPTLGVKFVSAGAGGCIGELLTLSLDTAKVRLQVRNVMAPSWTKSMRLLVNGAFVQLSTLPQKPPGMVGTLQMINTYVKDQRTRSQVYRQICFASIRIGCYEAIKVFIAVILIPLQMFSSESCQA